MFKLIKTTKEMIEAHRAKVRYQRELKEVSEAIQRMQDDDDYNMGEGSAIILRVMRKSDNKEMFRFLASFWWEDKILPLDKLDKKGYYLDMVPKEERIALGVYGTYAIHFVQQEKFALIVTSEFWRCRCPEQPVKAASVPQCPQCGAKPGDAVHPLRLLDDMI